MRILVDTNLLLRMSSKTHPMYETARAAIRWIVINNHEAVIVPQVLYEYWVAATRPVENNGLGLSVAQVDTDLTDWLATFELLDDQGLVPVWHGLVLAHDVKGKPAHDARLVTAMQHHGIDAIMTFNKGDFTKFPGIQANSPADVATELSR